MRIFQNGRRKREKFPTVGKIASNVVRMTTKTSHEMSPGAKMFKNLKTGCNHWTWMPRVGLHQQDWTHRPLWSCVDDMCKKCSRSKNKKNAWKSLVCEDLAFIALRSVLFQTCVSHSQVHPRPLPGRPEPLAQQRAPSPLPLAADVWERWHHHATSAGGLPEVGTAARAAAQHHDPWKHSPPPARWESWRNTLLLQMKAQWWSSYRCLTAGGIQTWSWSLHTPFLL